MNLTVSQRQARWVMARLIVKLKLYIPERVAIEKGILCSARSVMVGGVDYHDTLPTTFSSY